MLVYKLNLYYIYQLKLHQFDLNTSEIAYNNFT